MRYLVLIGLLFLLALSAGALSGEPKPKPMELVIYDLQEVIATTTDFPGTPGLTIAGGTGAAPAQTDAETQIFTVADVQTVIRDRLLPAEFTDPATSIEEREARLAC